MDPKADLRLRVLRVMVAAMFFALFGRLFTMQIVDGAKWTAQASDTRMKDVVVPATRGLILDQSGRVLIGNRSTLVVSIDASKLARMSDKGDAVLARLAPLLKTTAADLRDRITVCGTDGAKKPPICWNGSIYQPIPVAKDLNTDVAVRIMERRANFPGVQAEIQAVRALPLALGANLAHVLGYLGPVSDGELAARKGTDAELQRTDLVGRAGLEAEYDSVLRGTPGVTSLSIDRNMSVIGSSTKTEQKPGDYLVLNIDAALQRVVEEQLAAAIARAKSQGFAGDSGAAVVMDVTNGHVLAMASSPTYDPRVWLDGVTAKEYAQLTSASSNAPLINRAIQGLYAPASTFKVITTTAAKRANLPLGNTLYPCPSSITIGNRIMRNHESKAYGPISVMRALEVSCNTVFYKIGYDMWLRDGGNNPVGNPADPIERAAKAFGLGTRTGVDLPSEANGRVGGRAFKTSQYAKFKDLWCYRAKVGYPDVARTDAARALYLRQLASENCVDGGIFRGGDAANLAIGQGDTVVTPLQMAAVYSAVANGGTIWTPQVLKAVISADGKLVRQIEPKVHKTIKFTPQFLQYLRASLSGVITDGTGRSPFAGWPQGVVPIAAKTGSGEAGDKRDPTSWFNSFGPLNRPRYEVVMMVSQGGTGALTSGPSVRKIWEALLGVRGQNVNPQNSVLYQAKPATSLPTVLQDGSVNQVAGAVIANDVLARLYGVSG